MGTDSEDFNQISGKGQRRSEESHAESRRDSQHSWVPPAREVTLLMHHQPHKEVVYFRHGWHIQNFSYKKGFGIIGKSSVKQTKKENLLLRVTSVRTQTYIKCLLKKQNKNQNQTQKSYCTKSVDSLMLHT